MPYMIGQKQLQHWVARAHIGERIILQSDALDGAQYLQSLGVLFVSKSKAGPWVAEKLSRRGARFIAACTSGKLDAYYTGADINGAV